MKPNNIIQIFKNKVKYDPYTKTFTVGGSQVPFGITYDLLNENTQNHLTFDLLESTGSEWDPNTIWIYKSTDGVYTLNVLNNDVTKEQSDNYLRAKLQN